MFTRRKVLTAVSDVLKVITMLIFVFPFYWMIITAFKTSTEAQALPPTLWPQVWSMEAYERIGQVGIAQHTAHRPGPAFLQIDLPAIAIGFQMFGMFRNVDIQQRRHHKALAGQLCSR